MHTRSVNYVMRPLLLGDLFTINLQVNFISFKVGSLENRTVRLMLLPFLVAVLKI